MDDNALLSKHADGKGGQRYVNIAAGEHDKTNTSSSIFSNDYIGHPT